MNRIRLLLTAAMAVFTLAALGGSALASTASISPGGAITASGTTTFTAGALAVNCTVSLAGSITAGTYAVGSDFGQVTSATATSCTGGATIAWLTLPWRWRLLQLLFSPSFGMLSGLLTGEIRITHLSGVCLYRSLWGFLTGAGVGLWRILPTTWVLVSGTAGCFNTMTASGAYTVSPSQTVTITP